MQMRSAKINVWWIEKGTNEKIKLGHICASASRKSYAKQEHCDYLSHDKSTRGYL